MPRLEETTLFGRRAELWNNGFSFSMAISKSNNVILSSLFAILTPPFTPSLVCNIPARIRLLRITDSVGLGMFNNSLITLVEMNSVSPRLILSDIKINTSIDLENEREYAITIYSPYLDCKDRNSFEISNFLF